MYTRELRELVVDITCKFKFDIINVEELRKRKQGIKLTIESVEEDISSKQLIKLQLRCP